MNRATKWFYFAQKHRVLGKFVVKLMRLVFSCDIPLNVKIGKDCSFEHNALGVVISRMSSVGDRCKIYQGVTIGAGKDGYPTIGSDVVIYPNVTIIGGIHIGNNCVIGANSFVNTDIPENSVVAGVPAKKIKDVNQ